MPADAPDALPVFRASQGWAHALRLRRQDRDWAGAICFLPTTEMPPRAERRLGGRERQLLGHITAPARRVGFILGRMAARIALGLARGAADPAMALEAGQDWSIERGIFEQPVVRGPEIEESPVAVSISHAPFGAAALCFPSGHPMGIDIETCRPERLQAILRVLTPPEQQAAGGDITRATQLWSAREALSKALRCGLVCSHTVLSVQSTSAEDPCGAFVHGDYEHFGQYRFETRRDGPHLLAIALPRRTDLCTPQT